MDDDHIHSAGSLAAYKASLLSTMARLFAACTWLVIVSVVLHLPACQGTQELDDESIKTLLATDRGGMIKFYQPWCGHSTRMKPDWDFLADHFKDESSVFVADVNCQIEESLCTEYHPGGTYPTILVFHRPPKSTSSGERARPPAELYQGGRGFEDLRKFVDETLVLPCSVHNPEETCSDKARTHIAKWKVKARQDQQKELTRLKAMTQRDTMTYELSKWIADRIKILEQLMTMEERRGDEL